MKIENINHNLCIALALIGYIGIVGGIIIHIYKKAKGEVKDKSGRPNYLIIGIGTIVGGYFFKSLMNNQSISTELIITAIGDLFLFYVFSISLSLLILLILTENNMLE